MRLPARMQRLLAHGSRHRRDRALILAYHRVVDLAADPIPIAVSPRHFAEHLEVLAGEYRAESLQGLVGALREGALRDRSVVVTFDDGYADNLAVAVPILERSRVPATVFVTAGMIDGAGEFWWDELEPLVLAAEGGRGELELAIRGRSIRLAPVRKNAPAVRRARSAGWNTLSRRDPSPRHAAYRELMGALRDLTTEEREGVIAGLRRWAGTAGAGRATHRALGAGDVRALAGHALVEVGAHTVSHTRLAALSTKEQRCEIVMGKTRLEHLVGRPVVSFAYPFGAPGDYTPDTVAILREAGFACACANFPGPVEAGGDPFQLTRFLVRDWDGRTFARVLRRWLASA